MHSYFKFTFWFLITVFVSCNNRGAEEEQCKFGSPQPIFNSEMTEVEKTSFEIIKGTGVETILFSKGFSLELTQSGCNELRQDFAFNLPMTEEDADDQFWLMQGEQLMRFLGNSDPSLVQFGEWANVIKQAGTQMKLGEAFQVQTGYFVTVDKIAGPEATIVRVVLEGR